MTQRQDRIRSFLPADYQHLLIECFDSIGSTNSYLLEQNSAQNKVCIANYQTHGRGRRGRQWQSVSNGSILMSLGLKIEGQDISGLSLVVGLAVVDVLTKCGVSDVGLKWPNDVLVDGKKICGILVEMSGKNCVVGLGLNVDFPVESALKVDQPWVALNQLGVVVDKDELSARLITHCFRFLTLFLVEGFTCFRSKWNTQHVFQNERVSVATDSETWFGVAKGVDEVGALLIETDGGIKKIASGEATLRLSDS